MIKKRVFDGLGSRSRVSMRPGKHSLLIRFLGSSETRVAAWKAGVSGQCLAQAVADTKTGDTLTMAVGRHRRQRPDLTHGVGKEKWPLQISVYEHQ